MKINGKEIKEADKLVYLGSVVEKNGKIQNKIKERIGRLQLFFIYLSVYYGTKI
jgi:hypothetical protein